LLDVLLVFDVLLDDGKRGTSHLPFAWF